MNRFFPLLVTLLLPALLYGSWFLRSVPEGERFLAGSGAGELCFRTDFPGTVTVGKEIELKDFHPSKADFLAGALEAELRVTGKTGPVKVWFFLQSKEGLWFQSVEEFQLQPGQWGRFRCRTDRRGRDWRPVGHGGNFSSDDALLWQRAGVILQGSCSPCRAEVELRNFGRTGKRQIPPLAVTGFSMSSSGEVNTLVEGKFELTRDYFNVFDPDEIAVDYELIHPGGRRSCHPGFFTRNYEFSCHFTRESAIPCDGGGWAVRFLPEQPGEYRLRLLIRESGKTVLIGPWQRFRAVPAKKPGIVRVSRKDPHYFELSTGEFFLPVGLNIHSVIDRRAEQIFNTGELPDRGVSGYREYFARCRNAGINFTEIWMAAWNLALEQTVAFPGYYGTGRYNTVNAWKLDRVLEAASRCGLRVNLVLDNHGRISATSDHEWAINPINARGALAKANGGFLVDPGEFFRSPEAIRNYQRKLRYVAARWGADPTVFALELWSEIDLVGKFKERYEDGSCMAWIRRMVSFYHALEPRPMLMAVHVCGEHHRMLEYPKLFTESQVSHWAGDAYRSIRIPFPDLMVAFRDELGQKEIPVLVNEFGGASTESTRPRLLADIHSALWSGIFTGLAGVPMLWWHDFVDLNNYYGHYQAANGYLAGIDLRTSDREFFSPQLVLPQEAPRTGVMAMRLRKNFYGWIYRYDCMVEYPDTPPAPFDGAWLVLPSLAAGKYTVRWYDTLSGKFSTENVWQRQSGPLLLKIPPLAIDLAFKLEPVR